MFVKLISFQICHRSYLSLAKSHNIIFVHNIFVDHLNNVKKILFFLTLACEYNESMHVCRAVALDEGDKTTTVNNYILINVILVISHQFKRQC